jgi:glycosyltransferase involved in cell wall biosynthesis
MRDLVEDARHRPGGQARERPVEHQHGGERGKPCRGWDLQGRVGHSAGSYGRGRGSTSRRPARWQKGRIAPTLKRACRRTRRPVSPPMTPATSQNTERPPALARARLLMLVHAYYPLAEPRVEREAKAARDAGYDVEVVALRAEGEPAREVVDGISVRRLPLEHERGASLFRIAYEYIAFTLLAAVALAFGRRPDVAHVHGPPDFLMAAAIPLKLRGTRLVLDIHDLSPHMYEARFEGSFAGRVVGAVLRVVERAACALADEVVTVHEPYRGELIADGVNPERVTVIMNSADEALIERVNGSRPGRDGGRFTIAYHGTITHWYGVDLLVEALASVKQQLPGARAVILGAGDALDDARELAARLGVADDIDFSGAYLPIEEALARVAGADCGVIPNRPSRLNRFALSSKLFEYVALGIPVVVSRLETLASHFGPDEVTFFEPGDADSLAEAILAVARDRAAAADKVQRAREHAQQYAWSANATRYVALLDRLGDAGAAAGRAPAAR